MHLTFTAEDRLLAVVAHPDDAELLCAGTLARARDCGSTIGICVVCRGDKGQPAEPVADLAETRRREMEQAAGILGALLFTCGIADGSAADTPRQRRRLIEVLRQFRPTLVLAHSPDDYHPDHRAASCLAEAASWFAASRGHVTDLAPIAEAPELWWMDCVNRVPFEPSFYVDVSPYAEIKRRMLACHWSQIERGSSADFTPLGQLLELQMAARGAEAGAAAAEAFRIHPALKRLRAW